MYFPDSHQWWCQFLECGCAYEFYVETHRGSGRFALCCPEHVKWNDGSECFFERGVIYPGMDKMFFPKESNG